MKVLIADDSAITRGIFDKLLKENGCDVVALVSNGRKAVDYCRENPVDLVVSDYDMPEMNGIEAARILTKEMGVSVVIYSDNMTIRAECIAAGAILIRKPSLASYNAKSLKPFAENIIALTEKNSSLKRKSQFPKKKALVSDSFPNEIKMNIRAKSTFLAHENFKILCIGASTGGPTAVRDLLSGLGQAFPLPILYVQHLGVGADEKMEKWFSDSCPNIKTSLARDGETAEASHVYLAPADTHLVIDDLKNGWPVLRLSEEPPESFLRPAVNKLFRSAAKYYKERCLAVLMTGMGRDGAEGCKKIVDSGGTTIAEDKSTCTVFGMPRAAIEMGAATKVLPRSEIAGMILRMLK